MVASKESDLNLFPLRLTAPSLNVPVTKAEVASCLCMAAEITNCYYRHTVDRRSPKPTHTEGEEIGLHLLMGCDKVTLQKSTWEGRGCCSNLGKTQPATGRKIEEPVNKTQGQTWHVLAPASPSNPYYDLAENKFISYQQIVCATPKQLIGQAD